MADVLAVALMAAGAIFAAAGLLILANPEVCGQCGGDGWVLDGSATDPAAKFVQCDHVENEP